MVGPSILAKADQVRDALNHCRVEDCRATSVALFVLAVERLEEEGCVESELRDFFDRILETPARRSPQSDTRGT
jgi:hypothetical protein